MYRWPEMAAKYYIYEKLKEQNRSGHGEQGD